MEEVDYLEPFQSGFRPRYETEMAVMAFLDDLWQEQDRGSLALALALLAAFNTISHGIFLDWLWGGDWWHSVVLFLLSFEPVPVGNDRGREVQLVTSHLGCHRIWYFLSC